MERHKSMAIKEESEEDLQSSQGSTSKEQAQTFSSASAFLSPVLEEAFKDDDAEAKIALHLKSALQQLRREK